MRASALLITFLPALISAHGPGVRLVGDPKLIAKLKARNPFEAAAFSESRKATLATHEHVNRQATRDAAAPNNCGEDVGNCAKGYCCSVDGVCSKNAEDCAAPDCQFQYGPACDANTKPPGDSTADIARAKVGQVLYGGLNTGGVQDCTQPGVIALTFDDGPYLYTNDLLDLLDQYNAKATFFVVGNNLGKGEIDDCATGYPAVIKRMYDSGHQIASHTWSHQNLSSLTTAQFKNQIYYNEMAIRNIIGVIPTYMRPPYSECSTTCSNLLKTLGYHATYFDLDTEDYLNDDPNLIQNSKNDFDNAIADYGYNDGANYLVIEHDIHHETVYSLTEYILQKMANEGFGTSVTVGECLNDPVENWYRAAGDPIVDCFDNAVKKNTMAIPSDTPRQTITEPLPTGRPSVIGPSGTDAPLTTRATTRTTTPPTTVSLPTTVSPPLPTISLGAVSRDGSCGPGLTCQGSAFGDCCSSHGWCGSTSDYCGSGCQVGFGVCIGK